MLFLFCYSHLVCMMLFAELCTNNEGDDGCYYKFCSYAN